MKILIHNPLFTGLEEKEIFELLNSVNYMERQYAKGAAILNQGNTYTSLYIILQGECVGEMLSPTGKVLHIEVLRPPVPIAPAVIFSAQRTLPVSIISRTRCTMLIIPKNGLLSMCTANKKLLNNLLSVISDRFVFITEKLHSIQFSSIKEKILHYFTDLPQSPSGIRKIPVSYENLAQLFGIARPSLSRVLSQMEEEGVIERDNRNIRIL